MGVLSVVYLNINSRFGIYNNLVIATDMQTVFVSIDSKLSGISSANTGDLKFHLILVNNFCLNIIIFVCNNILL